jgi:transposase-like protein
MEAGENVSVLARELGVSRKSIYQWRNRYRLGGGNAAVDDHALDLNNDG